MYCDLHLHSTFSDGALSPRALVQAAHSAELQAVALTDHDTLAGLPEAREESNRLGLRFISGVEISTRIDTQDLHILGYAFEPERGELAQRLADARAARRVRLPAMLSRLAALGIALPPEDIESLSLSPNPGRAHLARMLVARGIARSVDEVFERWLGQGAPAYVSRPSPAPGDAIRWIREAGGKAVWAHPWASPIQLPGGFDQLARSLSAQGLSGLEEIHPAHEPEARRHIRRMARELGLGLTGGSDFHQGSDPKMMLGRGREHEGIPLSLAGWLSAAPTAP